MNDTGIHALLIDAAQKYIDTNSQSFRHIDESDAEFASVIGSACGNADIFKHSYSVGSYSYNQHELFSAAASIIMLDEIGLIISEKQEQESKVQKDAIEFYNVFNQYLSLDDGGNGPCSDKELNELIEARGAFIETLSGAGVELSECYDSFRIAKEIDFMVSRTGLSVSVAIQGHVVED